MAEDDSLEAPSTVLQSTATKRDARKVPGGFGIDDEDDLSPTKPDFPDLLWRNNNSNNLKHSRIPSLNAALPPLPPDGSSILSNTTNDTAGKNDSHMDTLDEREMRRHLMDIESSILPAPSPIAAGPHPGADDTYLFDGPPKPPQVPPHRSKTPQPDHHTTDDGSDALEQTGLSDEDSSYPSPKADDYKTPRPWNLEGRGRTEDRTEELVLNESGDTTASLETMSSPTAAARERTLSRARSTTSGGYETANERNYTSHEDTDEDHEEEGNNERTPRRPRVIATHTRESSDERSTLRHQDSTHDLAYSVDAGRTPGAALTNGRSSIRRPKYLRNRHTSQRSSVSSFVTNPESSGDHDTTGADYALQSGGAVPIGGVSRNSSYMLSRAISLGSIASGLDGSVSDTGLPAGEGPLATLDEEGQNRQQNVSESKGTDTPTPETPRGMNTRSLAPTDTVIAQHVRNLEVPETAAREYRSKHGVSPGRYSGLPTPSAGRTAKSLTLKEQSSTIDRLSKENWDLKLRIYFLSERLDKLSDEGVKDSISEIVELKTALATMQKDNKALKRKIRDLERKNQGDEERPSTARSRNSSDDPMFEHEAHEREEELIWLRERVDEYIIEIEKLKSENLNREADKRKLAEVVKSMGERRGPEDVEAREEMDVWKDLLEQETARREQADEDNRRLREEIFRLKATSNSPAVPSHNTTSNTYNIHRTQHHLSPTRPRSVQSDLPFRHHDHDGHSLAASSTLVEELRRESEQLRHENDELRREVGAQTSMLTSRNREKERLYQEIEDLKLGVRRAGGSIAGDSILERSASRAHVRSTSRASLAGFGTRRDMSAAPTSETHIDAEREDLENKNAELRDGINSLKLQNQELQRELETCQRDFEVAIAAKHESEAHIKELQEELEVAEQDLQVMQAERDETLLQFQDLETEFETLRGEAQAELDTLEADVRDKDAFIGRLDAELRDRNENFEALQREMRSLSEGIVRLEDDSEAKMRRIQELEQALQEASRDVEEMEKQLQEANAKLERLTVQHESSQNEISFLREEQDGDKIKISDLSAALSAAESSLRDEMERVKELEQRLAGERRQREMVASREKQEVQRMVNELNRECSSAKDEVRGLRKKLGSREVEAAEWKERLLELEGNLREALGDLNGTRSSLLKSISQLQRELESTSQQLTTARASLHEKDRLIAQRDQLLESHALESRRLSDALDKERAAHRNTKASHESFLTTHHHTTRTMSQQEGRVAELEAGRERDRRRIGQLEREMREAVLERNNLLLVLWGRLSALCGSEWTHSNSLINGRALPSLEAVSTMLPGFSKNLLAAVKVLENVVGGFQGRVRAVEREIGREVRVLEEGLGERTRRLERLEAAVRTMHASGGGGVGSPGKGGSAAAAASAMEELQRLRETIRAQKEQIAAMQKSATTTSSTARTTTSRQSNHPAPPPPPRSSQRPQLQDAYNTDPPSPAPSVPTGPSAQGLGRERSGSRSASTLSRTTSASVVEHLYSGADRPGSGGTTSRPGLGLGLVPRPSLPHSSTSVTAAQTAMSSHTTSSASLTRRPSAQSQTSQPTGREPDRNSLATAQPQGQGDEANENRWIFRLKELERRLKAEREARLLDRNGARKRLEEGEREREGLRRELERQKGSRIMERGEGERATEVGGFADPDGLDGVTERQMEGRGETAGSVDGEERG